MIKEAVLISTLLFNTMSTPGTTMVGMDFADKPNSANIIVDADGRRFSILSTPLEFTIINRDGTIVPLNDRKGSFPNITLERSGTVASYEKFYTFSKDDGSLQCEATSLKQADMQLDFQFNKGSKVTVLSKTIEVNAVSGDEVFKLTFPVSTREYDIENVTDTGFSYNLHLTDNNYKSARFNIGVSDAMIANAITVTPSTYTNSSVTLSIDGYGVDYIELDGVDLTDNEKSVSSNGTYKIRAKSNSGHIKDLGQVTVSNIDRLKPNKPKYEVR